MRFSNFTDLREYRLQRQTPDDHKRTIIRETLDALRRGEPAALATLDDWEVQYQIGIFEELSKCEPNNREIYESWLRLRAERRQRRYDRIWKPEAFYWTGRDKGAPPPSESSLAEILADVLSEREDT